MSDRSPDPGLPAVCPVCGSGGAARFLFRKGVHAVRSCATCTAQYVSPVPGPAELAALYDAGYFRRGGKYGRAGDGAAPAAAERNDRMRVALVRRHVGGGPLLDVGCATGGFLSRARAAGFTVRGVEISAAAAAAARRQHRLDVDTGDVCGLPLPVGAFSVLTLWDVIEHAPDPRALLRRCCELLRAGGLLFLSTGDVGSAWARACGRFWPLMTPPQHLSFHTRSSIRVLTGQAGLEVVAISHPGRYANLGLIALKARESFGAACAPAAALVRALRLERAGLYLNFGDVMTVVAAKPGPRSV